MQLNNLSVEVIKQANNTPPYDNVVLKIFDHDSQTEIVNMKLSLEEFTNLLLRGTTFGMVKANVNPEKIGKRHVQYNVTFLVPNDVGKNINSHFEHEFERLKNEGWVFNTNDVGNPKYLLEENELGKMYCIRCFKWE